MILVDGEKYACVQCIRGHRSSTCKHSQRPLVQVRSRGRPSLNAGHRIAVTASELVLSRDQVTIQNPTNSKLKKTSPPIAPVKQPVGQDNNSSFCSSKNTTSNNPLIEPQVPQPTTCCGSKNFSRLKVKEPSLPETQIVQDDKPCCSTTHSECVCGKNGVIMLRASKRQFVDVKNGSIDYVGPYNESSLNKFKIGIARGQPPSKKTKHIRNSSCCSAASASAANKLKLLKQIKMNEFDYQMPKNAASFDFPHLNNHQQQQQQQQQQQVYSPRLPDNYISRDQLAMGYPLSYSNFSHTQPKQNNIIPNFNIKPGFDQAFQEYQSQSSSSPPTTSASSASTVYTNSSIPQYKLPQPSHPQPEEKIYDVVYSSGCADECNCGPDCTCPGCLVHRSNEELKEYGILDTSTSSTPSESALLDTKHPLVNYDLINLETIDDMLLRDMFEEECFCKPEECRCYNCSKHGIADGIRLSDGVRVAQLDEELDCTIDNEMSLPLQNSVAEAVPPGEVENNSSSCCAAKTGGLVNHSAIKSENI